MGHLQYYSILYSSGESSSFRERVAAILHHHFGMNKSQKVKVVVRRFVSPITQEVCSFGTCIHTHLCMCGYTYEKSLKLQVVVVRFSFFGRLQNKKRSCVCKFGFHTAYVWTGGYGSSLYVK